MGFNRYMVECEFKTGLTTVASSIVLIDTWWNVNVVGAGIAIFRKFVLIDTWWNVNLLTLQPVSLYFLF